MAKKEAAIRLLSKKDARDSDDVTAAAAGGTSLADASVTAAPAVVEGADTGPSPIEADGPGSRDGKLREAKPRETKPREVKIGGKAVDKATAKAMAKTPAKKVATITATDIGDHLAATFDLPKSHAKIYVNEAVALIAKQLRKGCKVRLSGLGVFQVKKRPARKARNPNTGEAIRVKAGKRVVFAAAQDLKTKL